MKPIREEYLESCATEVTLYAKPEGSENGFYFSTFEELQRQIVNFEFGGCELSIGVVAEDGINKDLADVWKINESNVQDYIKAVAVWDCSQKLRATQIIWEDNANR